MSCEYCTKSPTAGKCYYCGTTLRAGPARVEPTIDNVERPLAGLFSPTWSLESPGWPTGGGSTGLDAWLPTHGRQLFHVNRDSPVFVQAPHEQTLAEKIRSLAETVAEKPPVDPSTRWSSYVDRLNRESLTLGHRGAMELARERAWDERLDYGDATFDDAPDDGRYGDGSPDDGIDAPTNYAPSALTDWAGDDDIF